MESIFEIRLYTTIVLRCFMLRTGAIASASTCAGRCTRPRPHRLPYSLLRMRL